MNQAAPFRIEALELGPMENFVYLVEDISSSTAAIVDPAWEVSEILALAESRELRITDILLTHSHHDHINGIKDVLEHSPGARINLLKAEAEFWKANLEAPVLHHGGDVLELGDTRINILHTPGHTPGSACYHIGNNLIAGDTLFVFGCGRCDLAGGDPEEMFTTLKSIRSNLPADTVLHPGHNYSPKHPTSTLAEQSSGNPFMHFESQTDFVKYRMHVHDRTRSDPYEAMSKSEALQAIGE